MVMVSRVWSGLIVALVCGVPLVAGAHGGVDPDTARAVGTMAMTPAAGPSLGASAAFGRDGTLWVVTAHAGHVLLRRSTDFGKTFGTPVEVNARHEDIDSSAENKPEVALGTQGEIYITWVEKLSRKWASAVWFARSTDGGDTFSEPIRVHHDRAPITHSFDALTVTGAGEPLVAWIDARDHVASMKKYGMGGPHAYKGLAVYYAWSPDGGKHFVRGRKVMDHSCECCRLALAREPQGGVALLFRGVYGDNIRDHAFVLLPTDGGVPTPRRSTFSGWQAAACPEQGPGLTIAADGTRHAVWYESKGGPHLWYGQLDPGHPPRHKLQIGGPGASHADVAVSGKTVWVAWNQVSAKGYALRLRVSQDGGQRFEKARTVAESAVAVYSPRLVVHDGRARVAWNTLDGFRLIPVGRP